MDEETLTMALQINKLSLSGYHLAAEALANFYGLRERITLHRLPEMCAVLQSD